MHTVLDLVALGRATRRDAKLRVRQPLRKAIVCLADPGEAEAIGDLIDEVAGELNVKTIELAAAAERWVDVILRPNFKRIGPRLGPRVQALKGVLASADGRSLRKQMDTSGFCEVEIEGETVRLDEEDIEIRLEPKEGVTARADRGMVLVLDTALDDELIAEWQAREVVAQVNNLRGDRGLAYEARIRLRLWAGAAIAAAVRANEDYVRGETLATAIDYAGDAPSEPPKPGAAEGSAGEARFWVDFEVVHP
jgi:isoleucyl-tRNA synthetase